MISLLRVLSDGKRLFTKEGDFLKFWLVSDFLLYELEQIGRNKSLPPEVRKVMTRIGEASHPCLALSDGLQVFRLLTDEYESKRDISELQYLLWEFLYESLVEEASSYLKDYFEDGEVKISSKVELYLPLQAAMFLLIYVGGNKVLGGVFLKEFDDYFERTPLASLMRLFTHFLKLIKEQNLWK